MWDRSARLAAGDNMALQPLSIGDILMLSQTAWKIGRAFAHGQKSAPSEFAEVEREANGLSGAFKLVAETLHADGSVLSHADDDTVSAVDSILDSARKTLDDLDSFVDRYQVIKKKERSGGGFAVERSWSDVVVANYKTFKWTTEGGDIDDLRNMLQMHTNSINLTMQALQSRSLSRLEKTVMPMAENIVSIHDRVNGDLGDKIDDLHRIIMSIANSTPSLVARDRAIESGTERDSISTASTSPRMLEQRPPRSTNHDMSPRQVSRSPRAASPPRPAARLALHGSRVPELADDYSLEPLPNSGTSGDGRWDFTVSRSSGHGLATSPQDSAYATSSRRESARRESQTLPSLFKTVDEESHDEHDEEDDLRPQPLAMRTSWRSSTGSGMLPPPALGADSESQSANQPATPSAFFANLQRIRSSEGDANAGEQLRTANTVPTSPRPTRQNEPHSSSESPTFEKQLFRNAAILCDVRCKLVDYAQTVPDEPDPRYNVDMVEACQQARVYVIRKRENREHGGTKVVTSIWCLSDDGEVRLQQKLSEMQETVPYCSYFDPEKVSLQPTDSETPIAMKFHGAEWGAMLLEEKKTNWVNYCFVSGEDAVAFQSAVFGRLLLGSYRTTKTTVIHEGLKGAFAFEEQFANIEMLRLWQDDGVCTPGAAGGVMALMHISSNFGEGCMSPLLISCYDHGCQDENYSIGEIVLTVLSLDDRRFFYH